MQARNTPQPLQFIMKLFLLPKQISWTLPTQQPDSQDGRIASFRRGAGQGMLQAGGRLPGSGQAMPYRRCETIVVPSAALSIHARRRRAASGGQEPLVRFLDRMRSARHGMERAAWRQGSRNSGSKGFGGGTDASTGGNPRR